MTYIVVSTGQDSGTAERTDRIGAETVVEAHTTGGNPVEVGRLVNPATIATDSV